MANLVTEEVQENACTCQVNSSFLATPTIKTVEGIAVAQGSLVLMSLLAIVIGAFQSVSYLQRQKELGKNLIGNWVHLASLVECHFMMQISQDFSNENFINLLYNGLLFSHAIAALKPLMSHITACLHIMPASAVLVRRFIFNFTYHGLICWAISTGVCVWYLFSKHWIAHDLIGFACIVRGIELLQWSNFVTGYSILGGLACFVHWILGTTNVKASDFTSSDAPFIRLAFPIDLLENGLDANNFATIGCVSILFPGVFIALLLRFDGSLNRGTNFYFNVTFAAYIFELATSILMKHLYGFYLPSLLYCACLGTPLFLALVKGDIIAMFSYNDFPAAVEIEIDEGITWRRRG